MIHSSLVSTIVQFLEEAPAEALKYFFVFFCKEALLRVDGKSFLDRVLEGSEEYAVEIEADIKERTPRANVA